MEPSVVEQILDELLPSFEELETQSGAILQFLKDKGIANDEGLTPYMEQARSASTVRWRAARLRINRVLAPTFKTAEKTAEEKRSESTTKAGTEQAERPRRSLPERNKGSRRIASTPRTPLARRKMSPPLWRKSKKENITDHTEKGAA